VFRIGCWLRRIFGPKKDEIIGWRKLHNEEFPGLCFWPNIIIKSRRMKCTGHAECIERRGMHVGFWWKKKEKDH
jgi:hypothetical protein